MDGGAGYERAGDRAAGDEEGMPAVERSGEYVEDCSCPYTDPEGGLPLFPIRLGCSLPRTPRL